MSEQNNLSEIETKIKDFIASKQFFITDNFPRCFSREKEIIMENKASALIDAILGTDAFFNFMNGACERSWIGDIYTLKYPLRIPMNYSSIDFTLFFDKIAICKDENKEIWGLTDLQRACGSKCAKSYTGYGIMEQFLRYCVSPNMTKEEKQVIEGYLEQNKFDLINLANKELYKKSLFECCRMIGHYNAPEEVLLRLDSAPSAYGQFKLGLDHSLRKLSSFHNDESDCKPAELEELINSLPNESEESTVQQFLYRFVIGNQPQFNLNKFFEKNSSGRFKHVYSFKDEYGRINQKVIKLFDFQKQEKLLIPCTSWEKKLGPKIFCVPLPKEQILYNLDLLIKPDIKAVILTDSIEIADQNQSKNQQIVWTSFLSELALVDWKPLSKLNELNVPIYYLITNHSGRSLVDAYAEASRISSYLTNEQKLELKFIQVAVNHNEESRKIIWNLSDITTAKNTHEVVKRDGSVKIMSQDEFNKYYEKSQIRKLEFWEKPDQTLEAQALEHSKDIYGTHEAIDYILRPFIRRKSLVMFYANAGIGKSAFIFSLCASIVSGNKIFKHRWWTPMYVPKGASGIKILYIDYRYDQARQKKREKDFINPYLPSDGLKRDAALNNLIFINGKSLDADPQNISHHQKFLDLLESMKNRGTPDHAVDLIVFDSYSEMTHENEDPSCWGKIKPLFDSIRESGKAVLLIHHANRKGDSRGYDVKKDACDVVIKLKLSDNATKASTLDNHRVIEFDKFTENSILMDDDSFQIKYDFDDEDSTYSDGKKKQERKKCWQALDDKGVPTNAVTANSELEDLIKAYSADGFDRGKIANMLGQSRTKMFDDRKKVKPT